jgi:hypothetical protein
MGESPLTMYLWGPVRDSFPSVCSHSACAMIPFPLWSGGSIPGKGLFTGQYFPIPPKMVNLVSNAPLPDSHATAL